MITKGKFIVIEGIDGSGKSTQINLLIDNIISLNNWYFTREASGGPIGRMIRDVYLSGLRNADERIINMLYAADRLDHITNDKDGILTYINKGYNVVSDRYYLSSMAYHTYMMNDDEIYEAMYNVIKMNQYSIDLIKPNVTFYIDIDPSISLNRILKRNEDISVYENIEKLTKIRKAYNIAIDIVREKFNDNIIVIDGNANPDIINETIMSYIDNYILEVE